MSDTTITPKERAQWLSEAQPKNIDYYEPIDFELDKRIRKLIGALEQAEANVHELEGSLSSSISKQSEMADGIERVVKANHALAAKAQEEEARAEKAKASAKDNSEALTAAYMSGKYDGRKEAEANLARQTKMVDWLAEKCAMHCHDMSRDDIMCTVDTCDILTCWGASGDEWKEAARRAVAAGEE